MIKWIARSRWSFRSNSAWGNLDMVVSGPSLRDSDEIAIIKGGTLGVTYVGANSDFIYFGVALGFIAYKL